jgi:NAD+ diphosphatase
MIAYNAEYAGGQMQPCDPEIADAQWFALDALPLLPSPISIARKLIDVTIARLSASD